MTDDVKFAIGRVLKINSHINHLRGAELDLACPSVRAIVIPAPIFDFLHMHNLSQGQISKNKQGEPLFELGLFSFQARTRSGRSEPVRTDTAARR
jgi:hypothetical protein